MKSKLVPQDRRARSTSEIQANPGDTANISPLKVAAIEANLNTTNTMWRELMKSK